MTTDRGDAAKETVAVTIDLNTMTRDEVAQLQRQLFTAEMRRRIDVAGGAAEDMRSAIEKFEEAQDGLVVAVHPHRGDEDGVCLNDDDESSPEELVDRLQAWHDAYHPGVFRLCREPQCADIGWGTAGPADLPLTVAS